MQMTRQKHEETCTSHISHSLVHLSKWEEESLVRSCNDKSHFCLSDSPIDSDKQKCPTMPNIALRNEKDWVDLLISPKRHSKVSNNASIKPVLKEKGRPNKDIQLETEKSETTLKVSNSTCSLKNTKRKKRLTKLH